MAWTREVRRLASHATQYHRQRFCGICRLFQDMERGGYLEESDRRIYILHLLTEHGVKLETGSEVLTR